jgi:16S rRNA processing protein RimM
MPEKPEQKYNYAANSGDLVAVGRVLKVRGLRGEMKIESLSDIPDRFLKLREVFVEFEDGLVETFSITSVKKEQNGLFVILDGVKDRTAAEKFQGAYLCIDKSRLVQLPSDTYYEFDLTGMEVRSSGGGIIGTIIRIDRYPANDVIVVETDNSELLVPAIKNIVLDVDIKKKRITMDIPDSLPVYPRGAR